MQNSVGKSKNMIINKNKKKNKSVFILGCRPMRDLLVKKNVFKRCLFFLNDDRLDRIVALLNAQPCAVAQFRARRCEREGSG